MKNESVRYIGSEFLVICGKYGTWLGNMDENFAEVIIENTRWKLPIKDLRWQEPPAKSDGRPKADPVNHPDPIDPDHYGFPGTDIQVKDVVGALPFFRASAIKYITRAGRKHADTEAQDLRKAIQSLKIELERIGETP